MRTLPVLTPALVGSILVLGLACRKPEPAKAPEPAQAAKPLPAQPTNANEDAAKKQAEEAARRQAEEEAARKAEAAKAFKQAAERALVDVHFEYDSVNIRATDKEVLLGIAGFLKSYPDAKLQIQGNCDERGTAEYNLALGDRRAVAVQDYLTGLGVLPARLSIVSYGKEKPVCEEHSESCWFRNRRAHFNLQ